MAESEVIARIRAAYAAFNRGDFERAIEGADPNFQLRPTESGPSGEPITGREEVLAYLKPDAFDTQRVTPLEFVEAGNTVVVRLEAFARGSGSGIELEVELFHVWRIREGRLSGLEVYLERDHAYEAAGLKP